MKQKYPATVSLGLIKVKKHGLLLELAELTYIHIDIVKSRKLFIIEAGISINYLDPDENYNAISLLLLLSVVLVIV